MNFRISVLDSLVPRRKRYSITDLKTPCLCLTVYPSGAKTFVLYRKVNGRPQRIKIGRYSDLSIENARKEATRLNALIALGGNPHEERKTARQEITFNDLYDIYYWEHALRFNKGAEEDRKMLERHFIPRYGNHKLSSFSSEQARRLHSKIGEKYPTVANRTLAMVSAVYNFGEKFEYHKGINPCKGIVKFKRPSRDRFLSNEELHVFFNALQVECDLFTDYFLILLLTGGRKTNVLSMRWSDIDMTLKRWRIPETRTKNKEVNIVYLPKPVLEILERRKEENKMNKTHSLFVFPGTGKDGHLKEPKKAFKRIKERIGVTDIRIHDLRRTLGSYMAISGASLPIIGKALNHKSQASTVIYARLSLDPVHDAIDTAVNMMMGNNIRSLFKESMEFLSVHTKKNDGIRFSELLAA